MLALLSMLRPLSSWQFLLAVCLLDLALLAVRMSWTTPSPARPVAEEESLQQLQLELAREKIELQQALAASRQQLEEMMAGVRGQQELRLLAEGVSELERGIEQLKVEREQARERRSESLLSAPAPEREPDG